MSLIQNEIFEEAREETLEELQDKLDSCDCEGSPAEPWDYCDDCVEVREKLNSI